MFSLPFINPKYLRFRALREFVFVLFDLEMGFVFLFTSNILVIFAVPIGDVAQVLEIK